MAEPLLQLNDVRTHFPVESGFIRRRRTGTVKAVDGVTLSVARGEVLVLNDNFCVRVNEIVAGVKEEGV